MGLGATDNVVDFADSIFFGELNSPSDLSLSYIAYWLRNSIGSLNNLLGTSITINTDSPFSFSTALNEQEKAIYKALFKIFYYGRKINDNLGSNSFNVVQEISSDGGVVRMVNKNTVALTFIQLRNQEILALNKLVNSYKLNSFDPLQVSGPDYVAAGETSDTKYTRALDKYVT